jgi:hypothetical protein
MRLDVPAFCLALALVPAAAGAASPPEQQAATAVLAVPDDLRGGAGVMGFDDQGKIVSLRESRNGLVCLADDPSREGFEVACYHKDLEPYMARGRELRAQGITGEKSYEQRWAEVAKGTLPMPKEPRPLYILQGTAVDPATGTVTNEYRRWVIYWPYATTESTGFSTKAPPGGPWLMFPGTAGAHIMITPPKPKAAP